MSGEEEVVTPLPPCPTWCDGHDGQDLGVADIRHELVVAGLTLGARRVPVVVGIE